MKVLSVSKVIFVAVQTILRNHSTKDRTMGPLEYASQKFSKENIRITDSWLRACMSFIQNESNTRNLSNDDMYKLAYHQLLFSDLNDIGMMCVPASAISANKLVLKGDYFLQIINVRDVSQAAYSQLQKITGTENQNTNVQAEPRETQAPWEANTTRMLRLQITDGTHNLLATEFEVVPALSTSLHPGTKMMLSGPVECRRGVILLKSNSVHILGGMVESLRAENSQRVLLGRLLNQDVPSPSESTRQGTDHSATDTVGTNEANGNYDSSSWAVAASHGTTNTVSHTTVHTPTSESFWNHGSTASTIPVTTTKGHPALSSGMTLPINSGPDPDDILMSQIDVDALTTATEPEEDLDEAVDEELLREQLDFQAQVDSHPLSCIETGGPGESSRQGTTSAPCQGLPYTKLSLVLREGQPPGKAEVAVIKGFISKPTSKLKVGPEGVWKLHAVISDDSATLEVDIHDSLLTKWMNITALEVKKKKLTPGFKAVFEEKVRQCQEKMSTLNGLLSVSFSGKTGDLPILLDYDEWTDG